MRHLYHAADIKHASDCEDVKQQQKKTHSLYHVWRYIVSCRILRYLTLVVSHAGVLVLYRTEARFHRGSCVHLTLSAEIKKFPDTRIGKVLRDNHTVSKWERQALIWVTGQRYMYTFPKTWNPLYYYIIRAREPHAYDDYVKFLKKNILRNFQFPAVII